MASEMRRLDVNDSPEVYYGADYWNNIDCIARMMNRRISGDETINWWKHFATRTGRVFERALILNCGNGWVEREMIEGGFIKEAVGIDYSEELLSEARTAARVRPIAYLQMNVNTDALPIDSGPFDLVVNHAAAHHVMRLNRVFRNIADLLPEDGWFISLDYVGPHRNQYAPDAWDQAWKLNQTLPEHLRQSLEYPSHDVCIQIDPTEAVHSELIVEMLHRYFLVDEFVPLGGALAYPVLTHNARLFSSEVANHEREEWGQIVLDRDAEYLANHPQSSLFAYFTGRPDKAVLSNAAMLAEWERDEEVREDRAADNAGVYYERSVLNELYAERAALQESISQYEKELDSIRQSTLYSTLTMIQAMPAVRGVLQSRIVRRLRQRRS